LAGTGTGDIFSGSVGGVRDAPPLLLATPLPLLDGGDARVACCAGTGDAALGGGDAAERGGGEGDLPRVAAVAAGVGDIARALARGRGCGEAARTLVRSGGDVLRTALVCGEAARGGGDGDLPLCAGGCWRTGAAAALLLGAEPTSCERAAGVPPSGGDGDAVAEVGPLLANDCRGSGCVADAVAAAGGATV
jgi:hypothetical protein